MNYNEYNDGDKKKIIELRDGAIDMGWDVVGVKWFIADIGYGIALVEERSVDFKWPYLQKDPITRKSGNGWKVRPTEITGIPEDIGRWA